MSGETEKQVSGWTVDTLKEYHDLRIDYERQLSDERGDRYKERWQAQEAASKYAQEKANEFRGSLDDLSSKQATKVELATAIQTITEKIDVQSGLIGELRSRLDIGNPAIATLQNAQAAQAGLKLGADVTWGKVVTLVSVVGGVLTIIILLANNVFK